MNPGQNQNNNGQQGDNQIPQLIIHGGEDGIAHIVGVIAPNILVRVGANAIAYFPHLPHNLEVLPGGQAVLEPIGIVDHPEE